MGCVRAHPSFETIAATTALPALGWLGHAGGCPAGIVAGLYFAPRPPGGVAPCMPQPSEKERGFKPPGGRGGLGGGWGLWDGRYMFLSTLSLSERKPPGGRGGLGGGWGLGDGRNIDKPRKRGGMMINLSILASSQSFVGNLTAVLLYRIFPLFMTQILHNKPC